jgi:hypothetical protein
VIGLDLRRVRGRTSILQKNISAASDWNYIFPSVGLAFVPTLATSTTTGTTSGLNSVVVKHWQITKSTERATGYTRFNISSER